MPTTIEIANIVKTYPAIAPAPGSPPTTTAVDSVTLRIEAGELFFLLGPSGCGKTTLLRMIAGFIEPTSGSIHFEDAKGRTDVTFLPAEQRDTGMVFQSYALWPHMTVAQNVGFGLEVRKIPPSQREEQVRKALAQVRMEQYAQRKPTQLSGGQQQRVALARAIVIRPRVLLLDEPLSNLDAKLRIELRGEIRRICKEASITGVYVTHDQKEALSMADRIAVMRAGKIIQQGTPRELYRAPEGRFVAEFLGETNLLEGTIAGTSPRGGVLVKTSAGELESLVTTSKSWQVGQSVLVSIRHEAWTVAGQAGSNTLTAQVQGYTYLGEFSQQALRVGSLEVTRTVLNPRDLAEAGEVRLAVDPQDVVVMPAGE